MIESELHGRGTATTAAATVVTASSSLLPVTSHFKFSENKETADTQTLTDEGPLEVKTV